MKKLHEYWVYLMTNPRNTVIYTGVTNDLSKRVWEQKQKKKPNSFTAKYNINKLVYCEKYQYVLDAIKREKQIKSGSRKQKQALVEKDNPEYKDLYDAMYFRSVYQAARVK